MKILFAGTPNIAVPSLRAIADRYTVAGVLTAQDKAAGRGRRLTPSAVKAAAEELGLPVLQPPRLGKEARDAAAALKPDLLVVFAYGRIFGPKFLELFPSGAINMHPSALPRFRGPSPLTAAILAGDEEIALTVQTVALEMDAGDILRQTPFALKGDETTGLLEERVARQAADELTACIGDLESGAAVGRPQDSAAATYCRRVTKDDGRIDWRRSAREIERMVRAYQPWPKARTHFRGQSLAILQAHHASAESRRDMSMPGAVLGVDKCRGILIQTGSGVLGVTRLQAAAKMPMDFRAFSNGAKIEAGMRWGGDK